jgi:hypothetical protein
MIGGPAWIGRLAAAEVMVLAAMACVFAFLAGVIAGRAVDARRKKEGEK